MKTITLVASNGLSVTGLRGMGAPKIVAGYGGWEKTGLPRRTSAVDWVGKGSYELDIPLLFDGWADKVSQEKNIQILERMAGEDGGQPPKITKIIGEVPNKGRPWVIADLTWGDLIEYGSDYSGSVSRLRQDVVVHLLEFIPIHAIVTKATKVGLPVSYVTRPGDTLKGIAARFYGDANKWKAIADANNIRDPKHLKPKTRLLLP